MNGEVKDPSTLLTVYAKETDQVGLQALVGPHWLHFGGHHDKVQNEQKLTDLIAMPILGLVRK